jgi:O-acetyl-ADP-ribose deacetylase (regulator of RNase III)
MIELHEGNLLEADVEALVNTVNTEGVMGRGIALQFKKAYPEMFEAYRKACEAGEVHPGRMHVYERDELLNPRYIINFPTKRHWREKSRLDDIRAGLEALVKEVSSRRIRSIAVPPLGAGMGGLNWKDVYPLIAAAFERVPNVRALLFAPKGTPTPDEIVNRTERPAMTISRANVLRLLHRYRILGYQLTLLEVHKLMYFLQAAGEPLRLRFQKDRYGPYADNLRHVLNLFEGHFTLGFGDGKNSPETRIELLPGAVDEAEDFAAAHAADRPESETRFERVLKLIEGFESPYGIELLATTHWVATSESKQANDAESAVTAVHSWNDRKRRMMKTEHIRLAWQRLEEHGWLR